MLVGSVPGRFSDDYRYETTDDDRSVAERKKATSARHASQSGVGPSTGRFSWLYKLLVSDRDQFMRAVPPPGRRRKKDLFAGVE